MAPRCWGSCVAFLLPFVLATTGRADPPSLSPTAGASPEGGDVKPSAAPNVREAEIHHERAVALYDTGDLAGARHEMELAYELAPNFRALFNLGWISSELHDYAAAAEYFERYLAEGGDTIDAERRGEVAVELADVMPHVAHLDVRVNVAGAEITVDDRLAGVSPLRAPIRLNPGRHRVNARAVGFRPHGSVLDLDSGNRVTVELQLLRLAIEATPPPPLEADPSKPTRPSVDTNPSSTGSSVPWLAWAGSATLAGAAIFSGIRALDKDSEHDSKREQLGITRAELDASRSSVENWSLATDAFTAAAIVMSGVSLYLTLTPSGEADERAQTAGWGIGVSLKELHFSARF
jgi:hypothetical protein